MNPDVLAQLKDIHTAAPLPWWPPAPGWWIVALLGLVLLVWVARRLMARYRVHQRRIQMLGWVDHLNTSIDPIKQPQHYLSTVNRVFKVVALRAFPDQQCALMAGNEWADFVRRNLKTNQPDTILSVLSSGPYEPSPQFEPEAISELARAWIKQHG